MEKLTVITGGRSLALRFEELMRAHYTTLYRAAYRLTRSVDDAEDLVQEVCVRAFPRLEEIERLDQPRAWLLRVLRRIFIDQTRRYERRHVDSLETVEQGAMAADAPGPYEETESAQRSERLARAWQRLDKDNRSLLALHDVEGYSLAEMMVITGLKEGTLKSRLHRARVKLGRLLGGDKEQAASLSEAGVKR